jgi:hypothetical protein
MRADTLQSCTASGIPAGTPRAFQLRIDGGPQRRQGVAARCRGAGLPMTLPLDREVVCGL